MTTTVDRQGHRAQLASRELVAATSLLGALACGGDSVASPQVIEIDVNPASTTVAIGGTRAFTAAVRNADGEPVAQSVFWSSSDTSVAIVSADGIVTARKTGQAQIAATALGVSATAVVQVAAPHTTQHVAHVLVSPVAAVVKRSGPPQYRQVQLVATALDEKGRTVDGGAVSWRSSRNGTASVDANGLVTGKSPGSVVISATVGNKVGTASVIVVK